MNELIFTTCALGIGAIASLLLIFYFLKKKRQHKDFLLAIVTFSLLFVISSYGSYLFLQDTINLKRNNTISTSGGCEIVILEEGGRFGTPSQIQVTVNNITIGADKEKFSDLKEGLYSCEVKYVEQTQTLIEITVK